MLNKLRIKGVQLHVNGRLKDVEIVGPPDFHRWEECHRLMTTACVGFEVVSLGALTGHHRKIKEYSDCYGPAVWPLLYQTEVRWHLEHLQRVMRRLSRQQAEAKAKGAGDVVLDPKKPWDSAWRAGLDDDAFWRRQFEQQALLVLTKVGRLEDVVEGGALPPRLRLVLLPSRLTLWARHLWQGLGGVQRRGRRPLP